MNISCSRWHEIDAGHRVVGQGGKCENLHGHRYRIEFHARAAELDDIGMVIDFGVIKQLLCKWLDENWDHKFLLWEDDRELAELPYLNEGVVQVPFNPTAENMAAFLIKVAAAIMPEEIVIWKVVIHETLKCHAEATI